MTSKAPDRILSIDVFRGLTMFLLIGEFTGLYSLITHESLDGSIISAIGQQLHHHPWNGLRFWDLSSGEELLTRRCPFRIHTMEFSPDGRTLAGLVEVQPNEPWRLWAWSIVPR